MIGALRSAPSLQRLERGAVEPCLHPATDFLGSNQDAVFLRCQLCGATLVRQGERLWIIPPVSGEDGRPAGKGRRPFS
jgi:hypothetical protein